MEECSCERRGRREDKVIHSNRKDNAGDNIDSKACEDKMLDTSPSSGYNSSLMDSQEAEGEERQEETFLIDLSSPGDERIASADTWNGVTIVDTDADSHKREVFEDDEDENMDLSFTQ